MDFMKRLIQNSAEARSATKQPLRGLSPHIHAEWEIKFFTDHVEFVPPRTVHDATLYERDGFRGALLVGEDALIVPADGGDRLLRILRGETTPAFAKLLDALVSLPEEEAECGRMLQRTLFRLLKHELECAERTVQDSDPVQETAVFLEKYYYRNDLSVEEIAARTGYTQQYLNRKFKSRRGSSILRELTRIRLRHARELLLTGHYLAADVARMTGWRNAFYFSRVYRRFYGFPPKETRFRASLKPTVP